MHIDMPSRAALRHQRQICPTASSWRKGTGERFTPEGQKHRAVDMWRRLATPAVDAVRSRDLQRRCAVCNLLPSHNCHWDVSR